MKAILYNGTDGNSALYVDNKLYTYGEYCDVVDSILELFQVKELCSDDYRMGGKLNSHNAIAKTVSEIEEYNSSVTEAREKAEDLRRKAKQLELLANEIESDLRPNKAILLKY